MSSDKRDLVESFLNVLMLCSFILREDFFKDTRMVQLGAVELEEFSGSGQVVGICCFCRIGGKKFH